MWGDARIWGDAGRYGERVAKERGVGGGAGRFLCACISRVAPAQLHLVVVEDNVGPALAAVDREARVLGVAVVDDRTAHKVRHRLVGSGAEGVLGSLGRLEEHVRVAVAVQLTRSLARRADVISAREVDLGDGLDCVGPVGLAP